MCDLMVIIKNLFFIKINRKYLKISTINCYKDNYEILKIIII